MTDLFSFTYVYGNGDFYTGSGYTDTGTYYSGQYIGYGDGSLNETGYDGYYYINSSASGYSDTAGFVTINSYHDSNSGYAYETSGSGDSGLGSESGEAYNDDHSNIESSFGHGYYEANLYDSAVQQYNFTYSYDNGDTYSGYFYAYDNAYSVSESYYYSNNPNQAGYDGVYTIDAVANTSFDSSFVGLVSVSSYYDGDYSEGTYTPYYYSQGQVSGRNGLGSEFDYIEYVSYESGQADTNHYSFGQDYYEADVVVTTELYSFTYVYGNGDFYTGTGYANAGTYSSDQYIGYGDGSLNETGYDGYYYINSVASGYSGTVGSVTVDSYYDHDSGYGYAYSAYGSGYSGLGSESGFADNDSDVESSFGYGYDEADL